jgi:hypothetical protein
MREDPAGWIRLTLRKGGAYVGNVEIPNNEPYEAYRSEYLSLRSIPLGFGVIFGLFVVSLPMMLRLRRKAIAGKDRLASLRADFVLLMLGLVALYSLTVIAFFVTGRYRVPMLPFFAVGASVAVVGIYDMVRSRALARAAVTVAIAAGIIAALNVDYLGIRQATGGFAALTIAQDRLDTGDIDGAVAGLERIRREGSVRAPEVYLTLARAYLQRGSQGDMDAAFAVAEEGLRAYPREPELLWYSAAGHTVRKDWAMVSRRIASFMELKPGDMRAIHLGFTAAMELGDVEGAREYLERGLALDPAHMLITDMRTRLEGASPP